LLVAAAGDWRDRFRSGLVRAIAGDAFAWSTGMRPAMDAVSASFDAWVRLAGRTISTAALTALNASGREFRRAFTPPADRPSQAVA
jgi:hypothetical protein